jgi:shikimate dehydrogenase
VATRRAAVLGMPVEHSLSPVLHNAAYAALGLPGWHYDRHAVDEAGLAEFVAALGPEWAGLSLTMPLKRVALEVADEVTPDVAAIGAANTLVRLGGEGRVSIAGSTGDRGAEPAREPTVRHGGEGRVSIAGSTGDRGAEPAREPTVRRRAGWLAANTDVAGIAEALRAAGVRSVERAVVLGAGGTAQAALAALRELGESAPTVLVRDPARAGALRATAERLGVTPRIVGGFPDVPLPSADVVVSTLPAGAADGLARTAWDPRTVVLDVIYAPWPTAVAAAAAAAGCRVAGGLDVLLHQAVEQVELMTGHPGPTEAMRAALTAATRDRRP